MTKMTKTLTALAAAATIAVAAVAAPQPAEARGGRIAGAIIGGLAVGALLGAAAYGPYYGATAARLLLRARPGLLRRPALLLDPSPDLGRLWLAPRAGLWLGTARKIAIYKRDVDSEKPGIGNFFGLFRPNV